MPIEGISTIKDFYRFAPRHVIAEQVFAIPLNQLDFGIVQNSDQLHGGGMTCWSAMTMPP